MPYRAALPHTAATCPCGRLLVGGLPTSGQREQLNFTGDLDEIVADCADDAVFITSSGVLRGKEGIRAGFTQLLSDLPNASWTLKTQIFDGDLLFLEWAADSAATDSNDGVDTFVFRDGLILGSGQHLGRTRCGTK